MTDKVQCPTCSRTVGVLASGMVRRHKHADTGDWCPGGAAEASNVVQIGARKKPGGTAKAGKMTPAEKDAANKQRPASKQIDHAGHGNCAAKIRNKATREWDGERKCLLPAGAKTDHLGFGRCRDHGGASPNGKKHAALLRARAEADKVRRAQSFFGRRIAVDPEQALLEEMQRSVGVVRWLEAAIAEWGKFEQLAEEIDALDPDQDDPGAGDAAVVKLLQRLAEQAETLTRGGVDSTKVDVSDPRTGLPTLVGVHSTEHAVGFTDTEYRAWLKVYQEERRHLAAVAKACIDANIAERRQSVLEARADMIRSLVLIALRIAGVDLTPERALEIVAEATRTVQKELPA